MERVKEILKGIWAFCSYVFVPQWGSKGRHSIPQNETKIECHGNATGTGQRHQHKLSV